MPEAMCLTIIKRFWGGGLDSGGWVEGLGAKATDRACSCSYAGVCLLFRPLQFAATALREVARLHPNPLGTGLTW
jgi:hypothetical protein